MKLHRSNSQPEWVTAPLATLNSWQRLAAATKGVVTPGNILTLIGLITAVVGLVAVTHHQYGVGIIGLTIGRLLDIADGWAADTTGTKSPLGEAFDASVDKLVTLATIIVLGITRVVPTWLLIVILLPHIIITIVGGVSNLQGRRLHPSKSGKLSMASCWLSLILFVAVKIFSSINYFLQVSAYAIAALSITLSVLAAWGYLQASRAK